ncbi:MAG TPA: UDP-3-O-(3-hydroxymyristoyl)glucosamine N-acyltransferase [Longimicrobiales bacterium]|nr:UDP-3-O-(3-hydroxymyristoyl)glucosamine N-acyltransferase [Longimicrobiales bacterium]
MKASEIAGIVGGIVEGAGDPEITGVAPLDRARADELSFLAHPRYASHLENSAAGAVLVTDALKSRVPERVTRIVVADVHRALAGVLPRIYPEPAPVPGIHSTAIIETGVRLGRDVEIGPYAVVGAGADIGDRVRIGAHAVVGRGCRIGDDSVLHPHVTLYPGVEIGSRSILHSGVRVGVDGFGYVPVDGRLQKVPQVGQCRIGDDVEIGANTTIDRGSVGATEIAENVKIDNLVHIAHNVRIGASSVIVAQVGIAGSTQIGRHVTLAGQAGIPGHLKIGDGATVAAQAGVFGDIPAGAVYSGYPARPHRESLRAQAAVARLPKLLERLQRLERKVFGRESREE